MQRGRSYPQSLDFWSEPDAPPTIRRPLEVLEWQYRNLAFSFGYTFPNSTGIFDPMTGVYAWTDSAVIDGLPYLSTIFETIVGAAGPGCRFDFDLYSPTTGEHFHAHSYTRVIGYPWLTGGKVYGQLIRDADTFVGGIQLIIAVVPRRYY